MAEQTQTQTLEQVIARAKFVNAYARLLRMELYLTQHVLYPDTNILDFVIEHNIIDGAKSQVVEDYLPFTIDRRSRNMNMTPKVNK